MSDSIVFDRAVENYDATRALTPEAEEAVVRLLAPELKGRGPCLEIGIGTGRMALPLLARGVELIGIDLSVPMLRRLVEKMAKGDRLPVALADATRLPFPDDSLGAVVACHVLHLIPEWRQAVQELARLLRDGGVFLLDLGGGPGGDWRAVFRQTGKELGITKPRVGLTDVRKLNELMAALGARARELDPVTTRRTRPLADALDELGQQIHSWTWDVDRANMQRAVAATRAWAEAKFGDLDEPRVVETVITWRAYEFG